MIITRGMGIDLGTTNSAIAFLETNETDLLISRDAMGRPTTPSCVWCDPHTGEITVGHRAYARRGMSPEPVMSVKRSMGIQISIPLGETECSPAEISSYILRDLKEQMQAELNERKTDEVEYNVSRAIITVPAYFGLPAIEATREAGRIAGLEVMELLHEPTAAAIYYCWKYDLGDGVYLVYDLGGGTFDVSILNRTAGEFLVLGISGDNFLGGDEFDRRLAEHLRRILVADGYDLELNVAEDPDDLIRFNQLVTIAERAKKELSQRDEIALKDQGTLKDRSENPVILELPLGRGTFESLIEDLLERTLSLCEEALARAREKSDITIEDIDNILLVGGSTYIPAVAQKVKDAFCRHESAQGPRAKCTEPVIDEPETAVALGAALRAAASGLGVSDDDRRVMIWFSNVGATKNEQTAIAGHVESLQQGQSLEGGSLRLRTAAGDLLGETDLKPGLRFAFQQVALQAETLNEFAFEVLDKNGSAVASLQRTISHSREQKEAVGRTLSTAVLSKPISLEGTDGERVVRRILLAEGTSLPAKASFTFSVIDASGQIRLPIYQENRIIKELLSNVGAVDVGTPVELEITCDEQVHIGLRVSIGDCEFGGEIEPPPPDTVPSEYDIQQLEERFLEALEDLEEEDKDRLRVSFSTVRRDLDEAFSSADYPKVIQRAADIEGLIREARLAEPFHPPVEVVRKTFESCLELIPKALEARSDLPAPDLKSDLEYAMERARQAYEDRDQRTYEDASKAINVTHQFLLGVSSAEVAEDEEVDEEVRAYILLEKSKKLAQFLLIHCLVKDRDEFLDTLKSQIEELEGLDEQLEDNPIAVIRRCQLFMNEAQRIYKQISPEEEAALDYNGFLNVGDHARLGSLEKTKGLFDKGK